MKKIGSYKELLENQSQLKALLEAKKDLIRSDVEILKTKTKPVSDLFGSLRDSERKRRLVAIGVGFAAKTVFNKIILGKAGWVIKLIAPYFAENSQFNLKVVMSRFKSRVSTILKKGPIESDAGERDFPKEANNPF